MYEYQARVIRVIDGDTIELDIDLGCHVHVTRMARLRGVNCPELTGDNREAGLAAKQYTETWLSGETVRVNTHIDRADKYGRLLVDIWIGPVLFNASIVQAKHAIAKEY